MGSSFTAQGRGGKTVRHRQVSIARYNCDIASASESGLRAWPGRTDRARRENQETRP